MLCNREMQEFRARGSVLAGGYVMEQKMEQKQDSKAKTAGQGMAGEHQDNLAEGELETVEESIRIHEQKGDLGGKKDQQDQDQR